MKALVVRGKMEFEGKTLSDVETAIDEAKKKILQTIKIKSTGITSGFDKIGAGNYRFEIGDKELFTKKEERRKDKMFRIKTWIPVDIDPEEDTQYITREAAEKEKAQLEEMQPENKYESEEVVE